MAKKKEYPRAIADHTEAIRLEPSKWGHFVKRGMDYYEIKDYGRAISDYSNAIRLAPDKSGPRNVRGNVYFALKKYALATKDYKEALRLQLDSEIIKANLASSELEEKLFILEVCNKTQVPTSFAIVSKTLPASEWYLNAWYRIEPTKCMSFGKKAKTPNPHPDFYYFARATDRSLTWEDKQKGLGWCLGTTARNEPVSTNRCGEGDERKQFRSITLRTDTTEYSLPLNPPTN